MIADQPRTEAEWQAEDDARTLARAERIKQDESRLSKAQTAAERIAERERAEANAMSKVARKGKGSSSKPAGSGGGVKKKSTMVGTYNVFQKIS